MCREFGIDRQVEGLNMQVKVSVKSEYRKGTSVAIIES